MKNIVNRLKRHLLDTLGITVTLSKPTNPEPLPFFLQDIYDIFQVRLLNEYFIVLVSRNDSELTPATIHKHIDIVSQQLKMKAVFVQSTVSSFNRKRLIAKRLLPYRGLGSGIKRALEAWSETDFFDDREGSLFTATVHRKEIISSEKSSEKIIGLLRLEPSLSAQEIAKRIGISPRAVEKQIARLKKEGRLRRMGPAKGGYWEVS
ncbi:MAG: winged helix-turn-helix transcriptional regulator [Deltaproteobacteria bacterium]|nr:winged helix-turn-helix transcriptional regulator [Deltaproteobacteria bacterium]